MSPPTRAVCRRAAHRRGDVTEIRVGTVYACEGAARIGAALRTRDNWLWNRGQAPPQLLGDAWRSESPWSPAGGGFRDGE